MRTQSIRRAYASKAELASRNKMLAKYPFAVKHVFQFRVSATDRFYFFIFLSALIVSSASNSTCCRCHWRYAIKSNEFISVTSTRTVQNDAKKNNLSLRSHCDLSIERVCLGTNMAHSNRRQGRSHVGENELWYFPFSRPLWIVSFTKKYVFPRQIKPRILELSIIRRSQSNFSIFCIFCKLQGKRILSCRFIRTALFRLRQTKPTVWLSSCSAFQNLSMIHLHISANLKWN